MTMVDTATVRAWKAATAAGEGGYTIGWRAQVTTQDGVKAARPLHLTDCQWTWDGTSTRPVSGTLTLPAIDWSDPDQPVDWRPTHVRSVLAPFGNRVTVSAGADPGDGPVWVPLGVGLIKTVEYSRPDELLRVTVTDLGDEVAQALTTTDFTVVVALPLSQFIDVVWAGANLRHVPPLTDPKGLASGLVPAGRTWAPGTSLWDVLQDAVAAVNPQARAWFDRDGSLRIDHMALDTARPPGQQLQARPDWSLRTGDGGHVTAVRSSLTRDGAINLVAVAVEDSEVADPEYAGADNEPEPDGLGALRGKFEGSAKNMAGGPSGSGTGFAVSKPSARTQGFTDRAPVTPRWPFGPGHPMGATFGQKGGWSMGWHTGTDFQNPGGGATVVAVCQGPVVAVGGPEAGWAGPHYVVQQASDGSRFYYCHLNAASVKVGQFLRRGDTVGVCGWQGTVRPPGPAGAHLHLERRKPPYNWPGSCVDWRGGGAVK